MNNINYNYSPYSAQLSFNLLKPNYTYTNIINISPQNNLYGQKQNLSGIKIQNINNNIYNRYFQYNPFLNRNYSISFGNNNNFNLNQFYRQNSSLLNTSNFNTNAISNNTHIHSNTIVNTSTLNNSIIYDNNSNLLYSMIFKRNNQNDFYSPQTQKANNELIKMKLRRANENYLNNHHELISPNMSNKTLYKNYIQNINYNTIIQNQNNINKNLQYFVNNKKNKIEKIEKIEPMTKNNLTNKIINNQQNNNNLMKIDNLSQLLSPVKSMSDITKNINNEDPKDNFDPNEFTIIKRIGEGTYGKIYLTQWKKNNRKYAMKKEIIRGSESIKKNKEKTKIVNNFIKKTGSKGVIKIYGDLVKKKGKENYYYVIMEIADRDWEMELFERQKYKQFYTEKELFKVMNQLIKTLSLLQKNHITHRDIKPQNVLISKGIYKISDFGEARTLKREGVIVSRVRGTELYMSPILFQGLRLKLFQVSHNTFKSDVFSLGMCIFYASTLTFNSLCDIRELNDMELIKKKLINYLNIRYSFKLIDILYEMLQIEENDRPDFITLEKKYFS